MGEAKRRKLAGEMPYQRVIAMPTVEQVELAIANAEREYDLRVRDNPDFADGDETSHCVLQAHLLRDELRELGFVDAEFKTGYAAWRVDGQNDGGVVTHHHSMPNVYGQVGEFPGHAWVQIGDWIIDSTTKFLPAKMAHMDCLDGRKTPVSWAPNYLFVNKSESKSFKQVQQAFETCFYYEEDRRLAYSIHVQVALAHLGTKEDGVVVKRLVFAL